MSEPAMDAVDNPVTVTEHHRSTGWIWAVGLALVLACGVGAAMQWRNRSHWKEVASWDPKLTLAAAELFHEWGMPGQATSLPSGSPYRLEPGKWLVISTVHEPDDVRISLDAEWIERIDAIELTVRADSEPVPAWWMVPRGVTCQFGGYSGVESSLSITREPGPPSRQAIGPSSFRIGERHVLTLESSEGMARMLADNRPLSEIPELTPLIGQQSDRVAVRVWAPILIHGIRIERVVSGDRVPVLRIGDALMSHGSTAAALAFYRRIADDHRGTPLAAMALAKAAACAAAGPDRGSDLQAVMERLATDHPDDPLREQVEALSILRRWRDRDYAGALTAVEDIQQRHPQTHLPLALITDRPGAIPAPYGRQLANMLLRVPDVHQLDLSRLGLDDITFLSGRKFTNLDLSGNPISDLKPLSGMPLERLNIAITQVQDFTPLRGLPLRILSCAGIPVADLSPLVGIHLEEFDCSGTAVADLTPLQGMPLMRFSAESTAITGIAALTSATLRDVRIGGTAVSDLSPLAGIALTSLDISRCPVDSLEAVAVPSLTELSIERTHVADLTPLRRLVHLNSLRVNGTPVHDLTPLAGLPLSELQLDDVMVTDLTPLSGAPLQQLSMENVPASSLEALRGAPLRRVFLSGSQASSLFPLAQSPIEFLDIGTAPVSDLSALAGIAQLHYLGIDANGRSGLDAAADYFYTASRGDLAHLVHAAVARIQDPQRLRTLAQDIGGRQRLVMGCYLTWKEARALANVAGATLVCPRSRGDLRTILAKGAALQCEMWSDLRHHDGVTVLPDGTAVPDLSPQGSGVDSDPIHLYWSAGGLGCAWSTGRNERQRKLVMLEWQRPGTP